MTPLFPNLTPRTCESCVPPANLEFQIHLGLKIRGPRRHTTQPNEGHPHYLDVMTRLYFAAIFALFPTLAGAQPVTASVPPPGTYDDGLPLKPVADGPPRSLIRMDVPDVPRQIVLAQDSGKNH
jgi:hypothetical protein